MKHMWNRKIRIEDLPDDEIDSVFANANTKINSNVSRSIENKSLTLRIIAFFRRLFIFTKTITQHY